MKWLGNNAKAEDIFDIVLFDKYGLFPNTKLYKYCFFGGDTWERKFGFIWIKQNDQ